MSSLNICRKIIKIKIKQYSNIKLKIIIIIHKLFKRKEWANREIWMTLFHPIKFAAFSNRQKKWRTKTALNVTKRTPCGYQLIMEFTSALIVQDCIVALVSKFPSSVALKWTISLHFKKRWWNMAAIRNLWSSLVFTDCRMIQRRRGTIARRARCIERG